jgi:hypothetical protein
MGRESVKIRLTRYRDRNGLRWNVVVEIKSLEEIKHGSKVQVRGRRTCSRYPKLVVACAAAQSQRRAAPDHRSIDIIHTDGVLFTRGKLIGTRTRNAQGARVRKERLEGSSIIEEIKGRNRRSTVMRPKEAFRYFVAVRCYAAINETCHCSHSVLCGFVTVEYTGVSP